MKLFSWSMVVLFFVFQLITISLYAGTQPLSPAQEQVRSASEPPAAVEMSPAAEAPADTEGPAGVEVPAAGPAEAPGGPVESAAIVPEEEAKPMDIDERIYFRYSKKYTEEQKVVCLTIDDGPNPASTWALLDVLAQKGVKATFFVLGCQVEKYPAELLAIKEQGHTIGNHTYTHNYARLYKNPREYLAELEKTGLLLKELLGEETRLTRAPGGTAGHFTLEYYRLLEEEGYITQDWNIDTQDSIRPSITARGILENVSRQNWNRKMAVVLLHDLGKKAAVQALPMIIDYYRERGYEFRTLTEDTPLIAHRTKALNSILRKYSGQG